MTNITILCSSCQLPLFDACLPWMLRLPRQRKPNQVKFKGAVARYCACKTMIDSGSWLTNRNRQKRRPATMRILRDCVVFAGTSRKFVSSPTTSSLILKSIRQCLIEGTINTVKRSLRNYTRNQPNTLTAWLEICDRFNGLC